MKKYALISVSDKAGIVPFAKKLARAGYEILSTGGTAKKLRAAKIKVSDVSKYTGAPEILGGRVKTLHPKIYGGILSMPAEIQIVVVNLYPFEEMREKELGEDEMIEHIDIGGVALLRAAAKNYKYVTVVTDPKDYARVSGDEDVDQRMQLARKAFERVMQYDEAISSYFRELCGHPELLDLHYEKVRSLRYGENPHQKAAFFRNPFNTDANVTNAEFLRGKDLSFNNILDANSAFEMVKEFKKPTVVFVKHNNPCGVASAKDINKAFELSFNVDPMSAFGAVVALNKPCTKKIAQYVLKHKIFLELIICPRFEGIALIRNWST
jgi:phosphoribosylaminoimidazolecarboxamide formyltransferase / IMP cyclohydrolase